MGWAKFVPDAGFTALNCSFLPADGAPDDAVYTPWQASQRVAP